MPDLRFPYPFGPLSLGCANLGNLYRELDDGQAWEVLDAAWEAGVRSFDTAPHYGLGLSERRLGAFLATKPRDEFILSTKAGRLLVDDPAAGGRMDLANSFVVPATVRRVWDFSADGVRWSLDASLERLGLGEVDILYLHDPDEFDLDSALADGVPAAAALRDQGLVRAIGVGSKSVRALLAGVETDALDLLMVAGRYTLLEQPAREAVLPACAERGVGIVNAAVFNSGLLATRVPTAAARYEYGVVPPALLARARAIAVVCDAYGVELPTAALQYSLRESPVRTVVVGARRPEQIRQNAQRMTDHVPEALWAELVERGLIPA